MPEALLELREDMTLAISSLSVGCRDILLLVSFERFLKELAFERIAFFVVLGIYRGKLIIKGIHNIIEIGYNITIIKGEYDRYMRCYSF